MKRLEMAGDTSTRESLLKDYYFDGMETCAVDGMCAGVCPVEINTGDLIKRLRRENHSAFQNKMALWVAGNFRLLEGSTRCALKIGFVLNRLFGKNFMKNLTSAGRKVLPFLPLWSNFMGKPPGVLKITTNKEHYTHFLKTSHSQYLFPGCVSRMMWASDHLFLSVCKKANIASYRLVTIRTMLRSNFSSKVLPKLSLTANQQ